MASTAADLELKPRRGKARLRAGIPAVLVTLSGRQFISLVDLSETGACVLARDTDGITNGILKWMDYEVCGKVVRRSGDNIGLQFEEPIDAAWVLETRAWLPQLRRSRDAFRSSAKEPAAGGSPPPGIARVPGMSPLKYGSQGPRSSAASLSNAAPFILGALAVGAVAGYGSSFF